MVRKKYKVIVECAFLKCTSRCSISHQGASALGDAIAVNTRLEQLYLSWNKIRGRGAHLLAKGIEQK